MRVATIAPIPDLQFLVGEDQFHLVLAHLLTSQEYSEFYGSPERGYVILDNSAYEVHGGAAELPPFRTLIDLAKRIHASEVVMPDKLLDSLYTFDATRSALRTWVQQDQIDTRKVSVMVVPQGHSPEEWQWCYKRLMWEMQDLLRDCPPPVIGLSKIYDEVFEGGRLKLLEFLDIERSKYDFQVHLLGYSKLGQLREIVHEFGGGWLRSIDTAKPIVYAAAGERLITLGPISMPEVHREADYFNKTLTAKQRTLALINIDAFKQIAGDRA